MWLGINVFFITVVVSRSSLVNDIINAIYDLPVALRDCHHLRVKESNVKFTLYTQSDKSGTKLTNKNLEKVALKDRIIFIIHGWLEDGLGEWMIKMKDAYLNQEAANIIVVDWSVYSKRFYGAAFCSVPKIGEIVANMISNLSKAEEFSFSRTQINGFSLGAHVAGYAGKNIKKRTGSKIQRINSLDAAGPGFYKLPINQRLDANDAVFVQGIHTSNWQFGYPYSFATADFQVHSELPEGCGAVQPGCPLHLGLNINISSSLIINKIGAIVSCNHFRAPLYFIQSITSNEFVGLRCENCSRFMQGQCKSSHVTAIMGENCPDTAKGTFYMNIKYNLSHLKKNKIML